MRINPIIFKRLPRFHWDKGDTRIAIYLGNSCPHIWIGPLAIEWCGWED